MSFYNKKCTEFQTFRSYIILKKTHYIPNVNFNFQITNNDMLSDFDAMIRDFNTMVLDSNDIVWDISDML